MLAAQIMLPNTKAVYLKRGSRGRPLSYKALQITIQKPDSHLKGLILRGLTASFTTLVTS